MPLTLYRRPGSPIWYYRGTIGPTGNRHRLRGSTRTIINHAAEAELCQRIKVKRFPVEKRAKEPATWNWVLAFQSASSIPLGALACFMFLTGARISEALAMKWPDVNLSDRSCLLKQGKTSSERTAHLPHPLVIALSNIPWREGRVFGLKAEPLGAWNNAIRRAGIKQLSFHAMRHGFATTALRAGINIIDVAKLGGWKTPAHVFATYGHATDDLTQTDRLVGANHDMEEDARTRDSSIRSRNGRSA